jgi:hypothetical protein
MGEVCAGYDEKLKRKVALKALRGDIRRQTEALGCFRTRDLILAYMAAYAAGDLDAWVKG